MKYYEFKHYLDMETGELYAFIVTPTAKTKYRFIEVDEDFLIENAKVFHEVTDKLYNKGGQDDKQQQTSKIVYGGTAAGYYVDLYIGSVRYLTKVTSDINKFEVLKAELNRVAEQLNQIKYQE